ALLCPRRGRPRKSSSPATCETRFARTRRRPCAALLLGSIRFGRRGRNRDPSGGTMSLDTQMKEKIYSRVCEVVIRKHFDPGMNGANWDELSKTRRDQILRTSTDEEFEKQIQDLLAELKTSHTGFRHSKSPNIPGRHAISATFMR